MAGALPKRSGKSQSARTEELLQRMKPFTQGLAFAATLPADANARYAGKDVKLGDKDAAVFWYKPASAAAYRVIHGDLSITEQDDAPQSPNAVPITFQFSMGKKLADDILKRHSRLPLPAPAPPVVPGAQADDPAARRVLDQTIQVYANCKSYRDTGITTAQIHSKTRGERTEQQFATAFLRPGRFRFEFYDRTTVGRDSPDDRKRRTIVWSDGMKVQIWSEAERKTKTVETLSLALGGAFGISGGTSATIAGLLLSGEKIGGKLQLIKFSMGFTLTDERQLGTHACHRIVGKWGGSPMTIWIDKQTHLVRRIDTSNRTPDVHVEHTTTYEPIIDEAITEELLEFDPPSQE
jgi:outer membrane lipoprotein-sorting protein